MYDLKTDPAETQDVSHKFAETADEMFAWLARRKAVQPNNSTLAMTESEQKTMTERLQKLGYLP